MPIELLLPPHFKELSPGFAVRRSLPSPVQQAIGPFLFFDHFGPVEVDGVELPPFTLAALEPAGAGTCAGRNGVDTVALARHAVSSR